MLESVIGICFNSLACATGSCSPGLVIMYEKMLLRNQIFRIRHILFLGQYKEHKSTYISGPFEIPHRFEDIPGPTALPILGNSWRYWPIIGEYSFDRLHLTYKKMYEKYGSLVKDKLGDRVVVHVFDVDDMHRVYDISNTRPTRLSHRALEVYRRKRPSIYSGPGMFPSNGEEWYRFRNLFQHIMVSPETTDLMVNEIESVSQDLTERIPRLLDSRNEVDIQPELFKWAVETIAAITLDLRLGCLSLLESLEAQKLMKAAKETQRAIYITETRPFWKYIQTPSYFRLETAQDFMAEFVEKYTKRALSEMKRENKNILLSKLMQAPGADGKEIFTLIMDMFLAGIDTTAHTTAFALYNLATNLEAQNKLYDELKQNLPSKLDKVAEQKDNLPYLKVVVKESLRLNPVGIGTGRILPANTILSDYHVPAGTMVILQHQVASKLPDNFKLPLKFYPERWQEFSEEEIKKKEIVSAPFGYGSRTCFGKKLAELEMMIAIAKIVRNFKISYHYEDIGIINRLTNIPDKPVKLKFIERR